MYSPWPVYEFRPLPEHHNVIRYAGGKWIEDDGEFDIAFVAKGLHGDGPPYGLYVDLPYRPCTKWSFRSLTRPCVGGPHHRVFRTGKYPEQWEDYLHENHKAREVAMSRCCQLYGCANGRGPRMVIPDQYIGMGLVRDRETKQTLKLPETFQCSVCRKQFNLYEMDLSRIVSSLMKGLTE